MDMHELFQEMFNNLPDDMKNNLQRIIYSKTDSMVADPETRSIIRENLINSGDDASLHGFESACKIYDLNLQVVQTLGNMKTMLSKFDENDTSSFNLIDNLNLLKRITVLLSITNDGLKNVIDDVIGEENENRNGNPSGSGT
jgi:hypothetical protein